ncbi:hypothetical protein FQN50_007535 [Emmonsiellopsis sp. PD_5]|nr:hypothetical protein FQN50_007535 [Emmonsiellopsis sp. PD_5]
MVLSLRKSLRDSISLFKLHPKRHRNFQSHPPAKAQPASEWSAELPASLTKRASGRLDKLPTEILDQIFLYCLSTSLPRASYSIASALSSERIYRILILLSFWHDPNQTGGGWESGLERPFGYEPLCLEDRLALQYEISDLRWFTVDRIKKHVPELFRLCIRGNWLNLTDLIIEPADREYISQLDVHNLPEEGKFTAKHADSSSLFNLRIWSQHQIEISRRLVCNVFARPVSVLTIPDKFLEGNPWTDKKLDDLEFIRKFCGCLFEKDVIPAVSIAKVLTGIRDAIKEGNIRALRDLLEIHEYFSRRRTLKWHAKTAYELPSDLFTAAICADGGHEIRAEMFKLLLRASAESIPANDPAVLGWAKEAKSRGDKFGQWLLDFIDRLRESTDGTIGGVDGLFLYGRLNKSHKMSGRLLEDCDYPSWGVELGIFSD